MNHTLGVAALLADLTGPTRLEQLADEAGVSADWLRGYLRAQIAEAEQQQTREAAAA